ncbi:hypothetical protein NL676_021812 [Syzygium grande]|nr:hypothetical protein NL676_021812 [Syzygium grande]
MMSQCRARKRCVKQSTKARQAHARSRTPRTFEVPRTASNPAPPPVHQRRDRPHSSAAIGRHLLSSPLATLSATADPPPPSKPQLRHPDFQPRDRLPGLAGPPPPPPPFQGFFFPDAFALLFFFFFEEIDVVLLFNFATDQ